jgi:hypothetical protein
MSRRSIATVAGVAIVIVGLVVAGALVARALGPRISERDATVIALRWAQGMNSNVTGYSVVSARYDPTPDRIYDDRGNLIYSESRSSCPILTFQGPGWLCPAKPAWILHLHAPAQGGFSLNDAYVVVNASDGSVVSASTQSIN